MKNPIRGARACRARTLSLCAAAVLSASTLCAQPAQPADAAPVFAISRFEVEGNSLLPPAEVDSLLAPFAGPRRGFADVRRAVQALERAYRDRGYDVVAVQLPEQELDQGVVRVRVIEQRIGRVAVEGNQHFSTGNVRASVPGLREGATPNIRDISASLKVANTSPAKQTTLALQGGDTPDTINATVRVTESKPWRVGLTADNTGSRETGRTRIGALLQHANLWDRDHVASLQYTTSLEKPAQVGVWGVGYHLPLYALGDSMDFFATRSNVDSGAITAGVLNLLVSGKGTVAGARYNHTLPQWGPLVSSLALGIDWRAYESNVDLAGFQLGSDLTVRPVSLTYSGQLALGSGRFAFQLTGVQNLPGGSNGGDADHARQRAGAEANYRLLRYGASFSQNLGQGWTVRLQANGQAARDPLAPGEQFGAGGVGSVRGFRDREVTGDSGYFAGAEIETPDWCPPAAAFGLQCRVVAFADGARVRRNQPLPGEAPRTAIASAGVGLRFMLERNGALQIDYGHVLDGGGVRARGDNRVHIALSLNY